MSLKKNDNSPSSASTQPSSDPYSPTLQSRRGRENQLLRPSQGSPSASKRSVSKGTRKSSQNLFKKARETHNGETYLKNPKTSGKERLPQNGRLREQPKPAILKSKTLQVHKELDIKLQGLNSGDISTLSEIIEKFGVPDQLWEEEDISCINRGGWQFGSQINENDSLIAAIPSA